MQYRSRCNIVNSSEMLYILDIFMKEDQLKYRQILHFYFTKKSTGNIWHYIIILDIMSFMTLIMKYQLNKNVKLIESSWDFVFNN